MNTSQTATGHILDMGFNEIDGMELNLESRSEDAKAMTAIILIISDLSRSVRLEDLQSATAVTAKKVL